MSELKSNRTQSLIALLCGFRGRCVNPLCLLLLSAVAMLSACSGGASSGGSQNIAPLSGNWQFSVANPPDQTFIGGLQGGFLLQNHGTVTGAAVYSVSLPAGGNPTVCNSGSAPITGTLSGQSVTLTALAGNQTFTFTGTLSSDGSTLTGTYGSTAGTAADGTACGTAQTGLQWSAVSVPPLSGPLQGNFHSTSGSAGLSNQDFLVSGSLTQGENIGASNATVTGSLTFVDPVSNQSDYPCFSTAFVNGQISGTSVILQIIGPNGADFGQIGAPIGTNNGLQSVTFDSTSNGYVLHSAVSPAYSVNTSKCPGVSLANAGDSGNICLSFGNATACQQPITLSPALLTFPPQAFGSSPTTQTITLSNNSGSTLNGIQLQWTVPNGAFGTPSDFNGLPNFAEQDTCAPSLGSPFSLGSGQSCSINVSFSPQESCPWLPYGTPPSVGGAAPALCPIPLTATLSVNSPASADSNTTFAVPITGIGESAIIPSTAELDFGAEAVSESSLPQSLSFTNQSNSSVQILNSAPCLNASATGPNVLPYPLQVNSPVSGLQVVSNDIFTISPSPPTILYRCDSDPGTLLPNFQISSDSCSGTVLAPQATCSLNITYAPQANTNLNFGLDYFLELNTVQCTSTVTSNCEIDGGRFPVELKANPPSPLRMSLAAGIDFGIQAAGSTSAPQTITLLNDPNVPNPVAVNFVGRIVVKGDYSETDNCLFNLPPGGACTLTITFTPKVIGADPGTLTINYTPEPSGNPQTAYLHGTGR